jgi:hypothetical protein
MNEENNYREASIKTANSMKDIAYSLVNSDLSRLSLPEVDAIVQQVSQVVPAGNVPGVILNGLARLPGRNPPPKKNVKRDIGLLFKGVGQALDKAVYGAFFAGPAAVIWGYQNLLKLAGKDLDQAFPEGTWQFYVDYAMRDDTARHANETFGFDALLRQHQIQLTEVDRATAWVMAALGALHQYDQLLTNEWRERVYTFLLAEAAPEQYGSLYPTWEQQRPYGRGADANPDETYPLYRRRKFDQFLREATPNLSDSLRQQWQASIQAAESDDLPAFLEQMSILAYLQPDENGETRTPFPLNMAQIGLIHQGHYYLIPACRPQSDQPADVESVRAQIAALMAAPAQTPPAQLTALAGVKRAGYVNWRKKANPALLKELEMLRLAPILLNWDLRPRKLPLAELRRGERGVGDHALTLFQTGETTIFDQSHIFFDGAWGAALAEIMTNEALGWAVYLHALPPAQPAPAPPHALALKFERADLSLIQQSSPVTPEVCVETDAVKVKAIQTLRRLFKRRNDLLDLTVNDLLLLYRAIHAATYRPAPDLIAELNDLSGNHAAKAALQAIEESTQTNPAVVIPVDASRRAPRDRLYPVTFEVPMADLNLLDLHERAVSSLDGYKSGRGDRGKLYAEFDHVQRTYLATLAGFGALMSKTKEVATRGESASVGTIKLLAHMPPALQRMLDTIPNRFDLLNDLIKGREVFSNVGAVVPTSTLTRFLTAKDDNDKKELAWGVITTADRLMRITLRDFRPHVGLLKQIKREDLATRIAQDYLDAYALGMNNFIRDLRRITETSRETRLAKVDEGLLD